MLPSRNVRALRVPFFCALGAVFLSASANFASPSPRAKTAEKANALSTPGTGVDVPLPIGHEAKRLVLPDYDVDGKLRVRFEAGTARRASQDEIEFHDLKVTTFENDQLDLKIEMAESTLNLETRVLNSPGHTVIKRRDFEVVGDSARFNTEAKQSTLTGNVKMVIKDSSALTPPKK